MSALGGGGSSIGADASSFLSKIKWDDERRKATLDGSFEVLPSTFYMGSFALSNGVQAVMYTLADGTNAIGLVNRFNPLTGSISNPKFFALGEQSTLGVETFSADVIPDGFTLQYTTAGDNLTYDFDFIPSTAGTFKAQYWIGTDDTGDKIFDEQAIVTQEQVDLGLPVSFNVGNPYILSGGTVLFVRFTGIDFKGNSVTGLPYFVSKILPYKEVTIGGHVEAVSTSQTLYVGSDYAVDVTNGEVTLIVPLTFTDRFRVYDYKSTFSSTNKCIIDFGAFGQGLVKMTHRNDDIEFIYVENDGWYLNDIKGQTRVRI